MKDLESGTARHDESDVLQNVCYMMAIPPAEGCQTEHQNKAVNVSSIVISSNYRVLSTWLTICVFLKKCYIHYVRVLVI